MRSAAAVRWFVGAALLSFVLAALAYFLVISPVLDETTEARERAESEQARIDQLEDQLADLRADFARLDEFKAELADLQVQLPPQVLLNELTRQIDAHALQADVGIVDITASTPFEVLAPVVAAPPPPPELEGEDGEEAGESSADGAASEQPVPSGPTMPEGFYAVEMQVTTVGSYADTMTFLDRLQLENERLLFVNGLSSTVLEQEGAQGGRPATEDGFLESVIRFVGYVLVDSSGQVVVPEETDVTVPLPSYSGNPFEPLL